jgi:hypothetical protein
MALPRAIQEQVDQADAFVATINGETPPGETPQNPNPAPQDSPEPQPAPVSQETQPKPAPVADDVWERKYLTLKGMYDAEVPRLHAQVREMNTQVQTLIAEAAAAKAVLPKTEPASTKSLVTEQDKEAFGSDLLDLIDRATESKISGFRDREGQLLSQIEELKGKLGNVSERQVVSDKDRFLTALGQQVPDWEALNTDQNFLTWLAEVDPVYGLPRQAALNNAYEVLDATRTAAIFKQFKAMTAPVPNTSKPNLQSQVAPTRSRTSPAPAASSSTATRIYTQGEIGQFYEEWRRGFFDEADAVRMEKEIVAAINEGRVR